MTIGSGRPILRASSKAKELPGRPISSAKSGAIFCASNCMAPFTTPVSPDAAYSFRFV